MAIYEESNYQRIIDASIDPALRNLLIEFAQSSIRHTPGADDHSDIMNVIGYMTGKVPFAFLRTCDLLALFDLLTLSQTNHIALLSNTRDVEQYVQKLTENFEKLQERDLDVPIKRLDICARTLNALTKGNPKAGKNYPYICQLNGLTTGQIHKNCRGFGRKCATDLLQAIQKYNQNLPMEKQIILQDIW